MLTTTSGSRNPRRFSNGRRTFWPGCDGDAGYDTAPQSAGAGYLGDGTGANDTPLPDLHERDWPFDGGAVSGDPVFQAGAAQTSVTYNADGSRDTHVETNSQSAMHLETSGGSYVESNVFAGDANTSAASTTWIHAGSSNFDTFDEHAYEDVDPVTGETVELKDTYTEYVRASGSAVISETVTGRGGFWNSSAGGVGFSQSAEMGLERCETALSGNGLGRGWTQMRR